MGNNILDSFEDQQASNGIPSKSIHYFSRYILCLTWGYGLFSTVFSYFRFSINFEIQNLLLILILTILIPAYSIFYHLMHAQMELKQGYFIPKFPKWMIGTTIGILSLNMLGTLIQIVNDLFYGILTLTTSFLILKIFCAAVVWYQEIKYFRSGY